MAKEGIDSFLLNCHTNENLSEIEAAYACTISPGDLADGTKISEIGLYDQAGDFVALKSFSAKGIDADMETIFECDDSF